MRSPTMPPIMTVITYLKTHSQSNIDKNKTGAHIEEFSGKEGVARGNPGGGRQGNSQGVDDEQEHSLHQKNLSSKHQVQDEGGLRVGGRRGMIWG